MKESIDSINIDVNVDNEKLQETSDILQEMSEIFNDTNKIEIKNNSNVYVTINNFNCTNKEYLNNHTD